MWWQSDFYNDSQTEKSLPLDDEEKKAGVREECVLATQFPKILRIGLTESCFYPLKTEEFAVPKVMWLLEYYNMNGTPPFKKSKRDLPRVKLFDTIEGVLDEINGIIGSAEYQSVKFMDAVIENLCTDINFKEIDQMASLENVYGVEDSSELKKSIIAWLLGIGIENIDDAIKMLREYQEDGRGLTEAVQTIKREDGLAYVKTVDRLLKML